MQSSSSNSSTLIGRTVLATDGPLSTHFRITNSIENLSNHSSLRAGPGNTRSTALRIKDRTFSRKDRVGEDEGNDYYRLDLPRRSKVKIFVENREFIFGPSLTFRLQRSSGSTIDSEKVTGLDEESIRKTLDKGTYYIRVSSGGESVPYRLKYERSDD